MFGWLKGNVSKPAGLVFKSNDDAFDYASQYMRRPLVKGETIFGQVLTKVSPQFGGLVKQQEKWRVRLATEHGVLQTDHCGTIAGDLASNLKLRSSAIKEKDLVAVNVGSYDPKFALESPMQYFVIICKLKPEILADNNAFSLDIDR
jgi:hypothetical protein